MESRGSSFDLVGENSTDLETSAQMKKLYRKSEERQDLEADFKHMFKDCNEEWDVILREVLAFLDHWKNDEKMRQECYKHDIIEEMKLYVPKWEEIFAEIKQVAMEGDDIDLLEEIEIFWNDRKDVVNDTK